MPQHAEITGLPVLDLVRRLCQTLAEEKVDYCHWKSNNALDRTASGDNDLDLLVSRADVARFSQILYRLGFKRGISSSVNQLPGVIDYFGYDEESEKIIHVHAHYQLVLGHDMTKNIRIPIEDAYINSSLQEGLFKVPAPEFEFIIFIIRMVLKHCGWETTFGNEKTLKKAERKEFDYLQARISQERLVDILQQHIPYIDASLFYRCVQAVEPTCSSWRRIRTGQKLISQLQANARHSFFFVDTFLKISHRAKLAIRRRLFGDSSQPCPESGGVMVAIVGGDGAGKSTVVDALYDLFSKDFQTSRAHIGKPTWSWTTTAIRGILRVGQILGLYPRETSLEETLEQKSPMSPGYPWLIREVCRARDRYSTYVKARRFAARGGIAILDRFSIAQIQTMDGPSTRQFLTLLSERPQENRVLVPHTTSRFAKALVALEENYYSLMVLPEALIVLRLDPEIAVQRRANDNPNIVRMRNQEIYTIDWDSTPAHVIDACQAKAQMLSEIKSYVWSKL